MDNFSIYQQIAERTNGDIYIGVVGPVRTGKSTFIKRFMDLFVIPNIDDTYKRERTRDELPQSAAGRTIMTTEPKFVPNEAAKICVGDNINLNVKLIDCVGYLVKGALGYIENNMPRLVNTPWFEEQIPFGEAAEIGTKKVINDHSTIGLLVTTDGTITDIPRNDYIEAEGRVVEELKRINKPFVIVLNSIDPERPETQSLRLELEIKYQVPVVVKNCAQLTMDDISEILMKVLLEFPVSEIHINIPGWINEIEDTHWLSEMVMFSIKETFKYTEKISEVKNCVEKLAKYDYVKKAYVENIDAGNGIVKIDINTKDELFYKIISEMSGMTIVGERDLVGILRELSIAKKEYDKFKDALIEVNKKGYGMVTPMVEELRLEEPEIIRQGSRFGVKLRASAPSIHMLKCNIETEIAPLVGTEKQSEELVNYLIKEFEDNPSKIWESNIFGKSLYELVNEGLYNKLNRMPEESQKKLRETLQKLVNDGSGGLICIIL